MRVLVAIDGSEAAGFAVDLVSDVASPAETENLVAGAVECGAGLFGGPWPALAMAQADTLEAELRGSPELSPSTSTPWPPLASSMTSSRAR